MRKADYYAILDVGPEAEPDAIRHAYRRAIAKGRQAETGWDDTKRAWQVVTAGAVLLDPVARAAYDARCVGHDLIEETAAAIIHEFDRRR